MAHLLALAALSALAALLYLHVLRPLCVGPLAPIPGPPSFALTKWRLALEEWRDRRTRTIHRMHHRYGPVVRIAPNEVHFNSLSARRTIYRSGSGFGRTSFYRLFEVYGQQNLFTFYTDHAHGQRKRLLSGAYAKSTVLEHPTATMVGEKIHDYLQFVGRCNGGAGDIYWSLHYFSLDVITTFLYGRETGGTSALKGRAEHQALIDDIGNPGRRSYIWYMVHFPTLTKWLYGLNGLAGRVVAPLLPMKKPTTYSSLRAHAWMAMKANQRAWQTGTLGAASDQAICSRLMTAVAKGSTGLSDLEIASECADHFLAGIDPTSDTLMFLFWALSRPEHREQQRKLIAEAKSIPDSGLDGFGNPTPRAVDRLPYLNAVIIETLRLYAPSPASEPRSCVYDTVIDGYQIPAGTVVSMSPYSLQRNEAVFPQPLEWRPERWLGDDASVAEMKKWWWAFSSGGRMCIGKHLALAEFALVPAVYRRFTTRIQPEFEGVAPAIIARVETFADEKFSRTAVR